MGWIAESGTHPNVVRERRTRGRGWDDGEQLGQFGRCAIAKLVDRQAQFSHLVLACVSSFLASSLNGNVCLSF